MTTRTLAESELYFLEAFAAGQPDGALLTSVAPVGVASVVAMARGLSGKDGARLRVASAEAQALHSEIDGTSFASRIEIEDLAGSGTTLDFLRRLPPEGAHALILETDSIGSPDLDDAAVEAVARAALRPDGVLLRRSRIGHGFALSAGDANDPAARMFDSVTLATPHLGAFRPGDLVLGTVANYPRRKIEPFVRSLRQCGFEGTVVLFVMNVPREVYGFLADNGCHVVHAVPVPNYRYFSVNCLRYFLYRLFLEQFGQNFRAVFLTDVGDVVFQSDVFAHLAPGRLTAFAESHSIGDEPWNAGWIANLYGADELARVRDMRVACSGTILAETPLMLDYLRRMTDGLWPLQVALAEEAHPGTGMHGFDQGVHNHLLHSGQTPPFRLLTNADAAVFTYDGDCQVLPDGRVATPDGRPFSVLHQYNRAPKLQHRILERIARIDGERRG